MKKLIYILMLSVSLTSCGVYQYTDYDFTEPNFIPSIETVKDTTNQMSIKNGEMVLIKDGHTYNINGTKLN